MASEKNNKLTTKFLRYLIHNLDSYEDLDTLCMKPRILKKLLESFLIDLDTAKKIDKLLSLNDSENTLGISSNLFKYLEFNCKGDKHLSHLLTMTQYVYSIDADNSLRKTLISLVQNSDKAKKLLNQIVENNLQNQYNINELLKLLVKDDKKRIKLNF